jgi:hypothetical protein
MAALKSPYWQGISMEMRQLLAHLGRLPLAQHFYLAGGTALALQTGHRRSADLDFFSQSDEVGESTRDQIIHSLKPFSVQVIENAGGSLLVLANGIRMGFFSYGYPLVGETHQLENVALASIEDIGLMKCNALVTRGSRKDFYDLFFIARAIPFERLLDLGEKKYALYRDFPLMVLESMTLFDSADRDVQPELFEAVPWRKVKEFFTRQAALLSSEWFG